MNATLESAARRVSGFSMVLSVLLIALGCLAIALPIAMSFGVVIVVSWLLMISGVVQFVQAFRSEGVGHTLWKVAVAILYFVTGLYLRLTPGAGLAALTLVLAVFLVAEGVIDIFAYLRTRKLGVSGWLLLNGIVTLALGVMIWRHWPWSSLWVVGTLAGISMITAGTTRLMLTLAVRRVLKAAAA